MLEFLDGEDRYALCGTRRVVEAARLPADVLAAFREWVLMGLCVRGRGHLSDYFFDVLRLEGVEDIEDEVNVFASFLAHEFDRFLSSEGGVYAPRFRAQRVAAVSEPPTERVPSPIGPALPPHLLLELRARGLKVSACEDVASGAWDFEELSSVASDACPTPTSSTFFPDRVIPARVAPSGRVFVDGVDWGDPRERFRGAAAVANADPGLWSAGWSDLRDRWRKRRVPAVPPVKAPPPDPGWPGRRGRRAPDAPPVGSGSGGSICGLAALVADEWYASAVEVFGRGAKLDSILNWLKDNPGSSFGGSVELVSSYKGAANGPYPSVFYVRRVADGGLPVVSLLVPWRGRAAPLSAHFPSELD